MVLSVRCWPFVEDGDQNLHQAYLSMVMSLDSVLHFVTDRIFIL